MWDSVILPCFAVRYFVSIFSFAIISMGKRELDTLLSDCLSSWYLMIAVWLFRTMPRVCLQFVIVVFPDHTHLLSLKTKLQAPVALGSRFAMQFFVSPF